MAQPAAAFLVAVSMLERRTTPAQPADAAVTASAVVPQPAVRAVPERQDRPATPVPAPGQPASTLADFARRVASEHHASHSQPITRDALCARLGVSNQLASDLLRQIRTAPETT